jgi:hypothetical protein
MVRYITFLLYILLQLLLSTETKINRVSWGLTVYNLYGLFIVYFLTKTQHLRSSYAEGTRGHGALGRGVTN